jgi:syntaxin-binding protein 5
MVTTVQSLLFVHVTITTLMLLFFAVNLQVLYKLKTAKFFDASYCHGSETTDSPFAVHHLLLCVESRLLCVAGTSHVVLFRFSKQECLVECVVSETVC